MAGDWIKIERATIDKPEVVQIAHELDIDQDAAFGKCVRVWLWADEQSENGNALTVTESFIDRITASPGFASALKKVGWLAGESGNLSLPNFMRHNGKSAKSRALCKNRVGNYRNDPSVTSALPEKRREEKSLKTPKSPKKEFDPASVSIPAALESPPFRAAWADWLNYRRDRRLSSREATIRKQLDFLSGFGISVAVKIVEDSIRNAWQGLFAPKTGACAELKNDYLPQVHDVVEKQMKGIH